MINENGSQQLLRKKKERIMVVDDEANNRLLVKTYLSSEGYDVDLCRSGEEALEKIGIEEPDLIILDVRLPKMDGYELCRYLKKSPRLRYIPVILATALRGNDQRNKGVEAGADDFIDKPYNKLELNTRIKSLVRVGKLQKELAQKVEELEEAQKKLNKLAVTDGLTGLYNYRAFRHRLHQETMRTQRFNIPLSLLMIDIDHFKKFNDAYGHPAGDKILIRFSQLLRQNIREIDSAARYGGEEFMVILPGTTKKAALVVAEKIRSLMEQNLFQVKKDDRRKKVTVSIGIAGLPEDTKEEDALINLVDTALYEAKNGGRNRAVSA